jgi:xanthine/CO dehydrogenase XdhC/CoxF family maturation factor
MLDWLEASLAARKPAIMALNTAADESALPLGALALINRAAQAFGHEQLIELAQQSVANGWPDWRFKVADACLLIQVLPQPSILICGAGPDAVPVAAQFVELGWQCQVVDHRAGYAHPDRFAAGCNTLVTRPEQLHLAVELAEVDAAIIMAHHLENDAAYLRQLAPLLGDEQQSGSLAYLGVLGPAARRNKLCEMAACSANRVHGPVGLDIGAELPEAIALSIAAEIHAALNQRNGLSLTLKTVAQST